MNNTKPVLKWERSPASEEVTVDGPHQVTWNAIGCYRGVFVRSIWGQTERGVDVIVAKKLAVTPADDPNSEPKMFELNEIEAAQCFAEEQGAILLARERAAQQAILKAYLEPRLL